MNAFHMKMNQQVFICFPLINLFICLINCFQLIHCFFVCLLDRLKCYYDFYNIEITFIYQIVVCEQDCFFSILSLQLALLVQLLQSNNQFINQSKIQNFQVFVCFPPFCFTFSLTIFSFYTFQTYTILFVSLMMFHNLISFCFLSHFHLSINLSIHFSNERIQKSQNSLI
ncbi:hypothetical protein ABPG72_021943 [Tetrahymena utriculariae]